MGLLGWGSLVHCDWCPSKRKFEHTERYQRWAHTWGKGHMRTQREKQQSPNQGHKPQENSYLPIPWSWTPAYKTEENFCSLRHPVFDTMLWQLKPMNTMHLHNYLFSVLQWKFQSRTFHVWMWKFSAHHHGYTVMSRTCAPGGDFLSNLQVDSCRRFYFEAYHGIPGVWLCYLLGWTLQMNWVVFFFFEER